MANENEHEHEKYQRASLKGRGWKILTGKSAPSTDPNPPQDEAILGQVDVSSADIEALLDVAPPAIGIRETGEVQSAINKASAQMAQMGGGDPIISPDTLVPEPQTDDAQNVGQVLETISGAMLKKIGGSSFDTMPDFAHHHVDEDSLPTAKEKSDAHLVRPRREGEVLNPPEPMKAKRATHEALPVIEARRATQTIDLVKAKLNRRELDNITPNEPETFG